MEIFKIKFVGKKNTVYNVVDEIMFKKVYEPKGWVIDKVTEIKEPLKDTEKEIVEKKEAEKKKVKKTFDDKLIKGE